MPSPPLCPAPPPAPHRSRPRRRCCASSWPTCAPRRPSRGPTSRGSSRSATSAGGCWQAAAVAWARCAGGGGATAVKTPAGSLHALLVCADERRPCIAPWHPPALSSRLSLACLHLPPACPHLSPARPRLPPSSRPPRRRELSKAAYEKIRDLRADHDAQWAAYKESNALFRAWLTEDRKRKQEEYLRSRAERDAERAGGCGVVWCSVGVVWCARCGRRRSRAMCVLVVSAHALGPLPPHSHPHRLPNQSPPVN